MEFAVALTIRHRRILKPIAKTTSATGNGKYSKKNHYTIKTFSLVRGTHW